MRLPVDNTDPGGSAPRRFPLFSSVRVRNILFALIFRKAPREIHHAHRPEFGMGTAGDARRPVRRIENVLPVPSVADAPVDDEHHYNQAGIAHSVTDVLIFP